MAAVTIIMVMIVAGTRLEAVDDKIPLGPMFSKIRIEMSIAYLALLVS